MNKPMNLEKKLWIDVFNPRLVDITLAIRAEVVRARVELGFPRFNNLHEAYAVALEEFDELWEEIKKQHDAPERKENSRKEAIQAAAMLVCLIMECT